MLHHPARRGVAGRASGLPAAARMSVSESGRSRTPVSIAESPSATERNSGTAKKSPPCRKYWKKNEVSPPRSTGTRRIAGSTSGSEPRASRRFSHSKKSQSTSAAAEDQPDRRRQAEPFGRAGLGLDEAPGPRRRMPVDDQPEAERRQRGAHQVELHARVARPLGHAAGEEEDPDHDHDLAREHVAPREVGRAEAADDRADRDRDRGGRGDQPVGARPLGGPEVRRHERDDRGQDQSGPETLQARPADQQYARGSARWR